MNPVIKDGEVQLSYSAIRLLGTEAKAGDHPKKLCWSNNEG